jgi:predicted nucleic acid-binding protein
LKVLVDTCVWSQVLRRKVPDEELTKKLKELIKNGRVSIIGPIRQEILSGVSSKKQFNQLKKLLSYFQDTQLQTKHFEKAAEFANICRNKGIQGSAIDFLICAVAYTENYIIFTSDRDFENFRKHLDIQLIR